MDAYRSPEGRELVAAWCGGALDAWSVRHTRRTVPVPVRDRSVDTHVTVVGDGAPRFVWLPGTGMSAGSQLGSLEVLARRGTVGALDLPGQPGLSHPERPRREPTAFYAEWLESVLDLLAREDDAAAPVALVASGLGAAVALSAHRPGVEGRVLVAPGGLVPLTPSPAFVRDHTRWTLHSSPVTARALARHLLAPGEELPDAVVDWLALVGRACKTIRFPRPLPQHYLDGLDGSPLVVAVGEDDLLVPPHSLATAVARRASARVVVVDGSGHLLAPQRWEQVLRVLRG